MAIHRASLSAIDVVQTGKKFPMGRCTIPEKVFRIEAYGTSIRQQTRVSDSDVSEAVGVFAACCRRYGA